MKKFIVKGLAMVFACLAVTGCAANNTTGTEDNRTLNEIAIDFLAEEGEVWDLITVTPYTENGEEWMNIVAKSNGKLTYYGDVDVSYAANMTR